MMRTCRKVSSEMAGLVLDQVPYRMFINYPASEGRRCRLLERGDGRQAEEVEIEWLLPNERYEDYCRRVFPYRMLAFGSGTGERKRRCTVELVRCSHRATWIGGAELMAWSKLSVFEEVVFRVERRGRLEGEGGKKGVCGRYGQDLLEAVKGLLEVVLGEGRKGSDGEGMFVLFRPDGRSVPVRAEEEPAWVYGRFAL